jgi:hypothetical protein
MSEIKKVKSPISNGYITKGKEYKATHISGELYLIINDLKGETYTTIKKSLHLTGKDWIVVE